MELARTLLETPLPEDIKQLAAEESYFGYGKFSEYMMLRAFGWQYIHMFPSDHSVSTDPIFYHQPYVSPILKRIREALEGKRHLMLVENVHVPILLDVLVFTLGGRWPSIVQNWRWLISTASRDVCEKSRGAEAARRQERFRSGDAEIHLTQEYYSAPPFDDLRMRDWAMLIKEALRDAARSIYIQLPHKGDEEFWLHVAHRCLYYGILYHPLEEEGRQTSNTSCVTSDELVRCWVAEDLIFSTAIRADISKKQSNYYRSAFEAGKVVIQALQQYSLLPIYPAVSTPTSSEESTSLSPSQDVVTGVSKLSRDVGRLHQYDLYINDQLRWVSFMNDHGRHVSMDWGWEPSDDDSTSSVSALGLDKPEEPWEMTTLILRGCRSDMSASPLDFILNDKRRQPLNELLTPHLHVLDLSYTHISSLPPSFSNLLNIYLLSLRGCSQLETLSPPPRESASPLAHLDKLGVLDMNGVPLLELTQQDGSNKSNLHYLDLSGSKFTTLPSEFFCEMSSLEELIFGNCTNLRELPPSLAQLSNLLVLHVEGTQITSFPEHMFQKMQSLHTLKIINNVLLMSLPMSLPEAKGLKELHLCNCGGLSLEFLGELVPCLEDLYIQTWEGLEDIKILGHPNLRMFSLSGPWIRCLCLCGCRKLTSVSFTDDLTALEDVDLSGTEIEEVPHNLPNLPRLRMLLLIGVPCFKRFPWHQLFRFPKIFYLHHSADDDNQLRKIFCHQIFCADGNQPTEKSTNTAQININDPRMFHSFNADAANKLVKEGQFLRSFNVQVQPHSLRGNRPRNNEDEQSANIQMHSTYRDVLYLEASSIMPIMQLQPMQRHIQISAVNQYPNGLRHILLVTNSIFITDDAFVRCLTDLNYNLSELEECRLQRCHQMTTLFLMHSEGSEALPNLQILHVLDLNNLLSLVETSSLSYSALMTLNLLKHIHLEHCPRLEKMFPYSLSLPALETLVILFCSNLKTIFYIQRGYRVAPSPLLSIKRIYLQELPQLLHIHDDVTFRFETPKWEKLFVRGCQSFHHLPLLKMERPKSKVEVRGEREWWDKLQMQLPEQSDYYWHVPPPEFVSRKKHYNPKLPEVSFFSYPHN